MPRRDDDPAGAEGRPRADLDATMIASAQAIEPTAKLVATLVVVRGADLGRHFPLRRNRVVLGRGDAADVVLQDKQISRAHAAIESLRAGGETIYRLTDLGSTNHVYVNGRRADSHPLSDGDKIQLGDIVLKFELHDAIDARFHTEIRNRIRYDDLTGLLTYESFRTALEWELERYGSSPKGCGVVMMDLDDFKKLNDSHGHLAGSAVLAQVGSLIRDKLRYFDVAARYGGEEFVAYLPETHTAEAFTAAERLRLLFVEQVFHYDGRTIPLTISMGVSHFPEDGGELVELVAVADERLYAAKRAGKNRVVGG
jgi:two-component system, cell cycle response regulator